MSCNVEWLLLWGAAVAASLAGCGGETVKLPGTVPFSGKVTLDGKPLAGAAVQFSPSRTAKDGYAASGRTNDEGKYELTTMIGNHSKPGVVPGSYQVVVSLLTSADGKPYDPVSKTVPSVKQSLKPEYSDLQTTRLVATVTDKGGTQDFELKSK